MKTWRIRNPEWLGAHVRARRHELELSQEQVADRAELPPAAISQLERGSHIPSLATLERILDVLGEDLLIGTRAGAPADSPS